MINKNSQIFLIAFGISFFILVLINHFQAIIEEFFLWRELKDQPVKAQIGVFFEKLKPLRNWKIKNLDLQAKASIAVFIEKTGKEKILYGENIEKPLPIASLTKLMTALIAKENFEDSKLLEIEKLLPEDKISLKIGDTFEIKDLLYFLLVASNNTAANALSQLKGEKEFVSLMNIKAKKLKMSKTVFFNPTGIDPDYPEKKVNLSTAKDLIKLGKEILKDPFLIEILATKEIDIYSRNNLTPYKLVNTNELLGKISDVIVGKTGWTPLAKDCLLLITKAPKKGVIISVVLGSNNRFEETKKLIEWIKKAYVF
jgi:D-alanyl-D-alanine carboxypeptidase